MPTGYTAEIYNGNTSAKDYILRCARAFGALGFMRDEPFSAPIPEKVPEDTYPKECYEKARKRLEELKAMSEEDIHGRTFMLMRKSKQAGSDLGNGMLLRMPDTTKY